MVPRSSGDELPQFARRLDHLWRTVHPGDKPYTYEQVIDGLAQLGYDVSKTYLWQLRKGARDNPTLQHVQGLAQFFGVPASYFLDDAEADRINRQLEVIVAMRDAGVRSIALRAHGLSADDLSAVGSVIASLRSARGLADPEQQDPSAPEEDMQ